MNNLHVKTGDNVMIISGKDKGHTGKVLQVSPSENKVIVEGQNMVTKHVKPRRQGEQGGIVKAEGAMYASKVMPICPKCGKAVRVGHVDSKAAKELGWTAENGIREMCEDSWRWQSNNPNGYED